MVLCAYLRRRWLPLTSVQSDVNEMPTENPAMSPEPKPKLTLKERAERNPLIFMVSCVVVAIGVSVGVQQYFYNQQAAADQRKFNALSERLASIRRGLPDSEYLDVRDLVYVKGSTNTQIPSASAYFADGSFYASTASSWQHSVITEAQLMEDFTGIDIHQTSFWDVSQIAKLHIWRPKAKPIQLDGANFKQIFPYVFVQCFSFDQLDKLARLSTGESAVLASGIGDNTPAEHVDEEVDFHNNYEKYLRNDVVGSIFTIKLYTMAIMAQFPKQSVTLLNVQKVGNVLYSQVLITLHDLKADSKHYDNYYIKEEIIIVATPNGVALIQTFIPSDDPSFRDPNSTIITSWLQDFRVVVG